MTETAQQLVDRLTGFTPNTVAVEMKHSFHIHRKGDTACYQGRRADVIYWDKNHTGVAHNPLYDEAKANAALYAAAADLHRHVVDLLAREAVLREAMEDAEYDLCQWLECGPELIKAGFNMDGTAEVIAKVRAALSVKP